MLQFSCKIDNFFILKASKSSGVIYPVMVFFHGGNFQTGTANDWPGHVLASRGMVVVTVNYRLGAFGTNLKQNYIMFSFF